MTTLPVTRSAASTGSPLGRLDRFGNSPALLADGTVLSYADLADRVRQRVALLGATRRLVLLECSNDLDTVVTYLAVLEGRHPVLLAGQDCLRDDLIDTYRPDVVARGPVLDLRPHGTREMHPDLAVLLSTSGSTGSPKLVRLSRENLRSNARSIATYLDLTPDDRAATTLPMHYCYGLSVVNSHLLVGASVMLTDASVVDEQFWTDFARARATSFAGVPHTFDLLDSSGFAERKLPTLRTVTQAGGRLDPATAHRYALMGRRRGFDLFLMYGATEATARMAYLPPHLVADRPETIGIPIPGGTLRIDGDGDVGELVYTGDNVMLGYAHKPEDLALGRTVHELRTGDLARQHEDGLFELVGRRSRIAKLFGVRIDLDRVEALAAEAGGATCAVEYDGRLHLFVTSHRHASSARTLGQRLGLPPHAVDVAVLGELPVTANGKPDHAALIEHAKAAARTRDHSGGPITAGRIRDLYAHLLGRQDATEDDSFISLRGDSLSYVEASVRMGALLPALPADWAQQAARQLAAHAPPPKRERRWTATVETSVALRALAIVLIVASHANVLSVTGGAHVLLAVVGFNLARLQLSEQPRRERRRSLFRVARNVAIPSALWIGGVALVTRMYDASTVLMLNNLLGSNTWDVRWQFWFLEAVVWTLVGVGVVLPLTVVDHLERSRPFAFATGVFAVALSVRYALVGVEAGPTERYALPVVVWCVALGWMAARSHTRRECTITSVAALLGCWGFFGDPLREALVAAGVCLLVLVPRMTIPVALLPVISTMAASSLFVYLTHWQVYPHLEMDHPMWATLASFGVGVIVWRMYGGLGTMSAGLRRSAMSRLSQRCTHVVPHGAQRWSWSWR